MNQIAKGLFMKWSYNPEISLGNLLQILTIAVGAFGAFSALQQNDVRHDAEISATKEQLAEVKQKQDQITKDVREEIKDVKRGVEGINDKLTTVLIENARRNQR